MIATGKVALVTGCGKRIGIGASCAKALAAAGHTVVVSDVALAGVTNHHEKPDDADAAWGGLNALIDDIKAAGGTATAVLGSVSVEADANRMVAEVVERHGSLDILVNNAGAPHGADRADIEKVPLSAWEEVMAINARGPFLMTRAAIPHMRKNKWGRVINIASASVHYHSDHMAVYTASKAAVVGFSQSVAMDVARQGITVNAVCPGPTVTSRAISSTRHKGWTDVEAGLAERAKGIPVGRNGRPEDMAAMVAFLASDQASFVTAQYITVDGGGCGFPQVRAQS